MSRKCFSHLIVGLEAIHGQLLPPGVRLAQAGRGLWLGRGRATAHHCPLSMTPMPSGPGHLGFDAATVYGEAPPGGSRKLLSHPGCSGVRRLFRLPFEDKDIVFPTMTSRPVSVAKEGTSGSRNFVLLKALSKGREARADPVHFTSGQLDAQRPYGRKEEPSSGQLPGAVCPQARGWFIDARTNLAADPDPEEEREANNPSRFRKHGVEGVRERGPRGRNM
jgi:hypothetical protein